MGFTRAELESGRLLWLLTLTIRGQIFRFSTEPVSVTNSDPKIGPVTYQYKSGLAFLEYEEAIGLFETEPSSREVSVEVLFGPGAADGWALIADPEQDLGTGTGELSLLLEGGDFADRQIVVSGNLEQPTHGSRNEPVKFTLSESDWDDPAIFPPAEAVAKYGNWPTTIISGNQIGIDDAILDEPYPFVFGNPGAQPPPHWFGGGASNRMASTPGLLVKIDQTDEDNLTNDATVLIAGHRITGTDPTVNVWNADKFGWFSSVVDVDHTVDGSGREVATITWTPVGASTDPTKIETGTELWIAWTGAGGLAAEDGIRPMTSAAEIVEYLLDRSQLRIDTLRSRVVFDEVANYRLDFWVNEGRSPWEIIVEDILPILPISAQVTHEGLGFVYWNWAATSADATHHFDMLREFGERTSDVEISATDDVYNVIRIDYCRTGPEGKFVRSLTYTHGSTDTDTDTVHNPYCWASFTRYGNREGLTIDAPVVEQEGTARAILDWKARYHTQTHRTVTYRFSQAAQVYQVGQCVTITDDDIAWSSVVCLITGVIRAPGVAEITFTTVSDWARTGLVT